MVTFGTFLSYKLWHDYSNVTYFGFGGEVRRCRIFSGILSVLSESSICKDIFHSIHIIPAVKDDFERTTWTEDDYLIPCTIAVHNFASDHNFHTHWKCFSVHVKLYINFFTIFVKYFTKRYILLFAMCRYISCNIGKWKSVKK